MELNKENVKKIKELILFTVLIIIVLWKHTVILDILHFISGIIFPFLLGGAIAFVLNVPMNFLENKIFKKWKTGQRKNAQKLARPASLMLTILCLIGALMLVVFVVAPQLGTTFASIGKNIQAFVPRFTGMVEDIFHNNKNITAWLAELNMDWDKILDSVLGFFKNGAGNVLDSTMSVAKNIVSSVTTFFIAFVFACYILLQKEKLRVQVSKLLYAYLPVKRVEGILDVCSLTYRCFANFLTGQCMEAVIFGSMCFAALVILRIPYALLIGVVVAFTALIPLLGAFIGCGIGVLLILMENPLKAVVFVIVFLVLQQIEGNFVYPKVVGSSIGLPSIWVLAAVSIGGSLMGVVGILVFIPLVSVIYTLIKQDVYRRLEQKGIIVSQSASGTDVKK